MCGYAVCLYEHMVYMFLLHVKSEIKGNDCHDLQCLAKGLDYARKSLSLESKIRCGDIRAARIHRLYRQFQDLYQILEIQRADGEPKGKPA